MAADWGQRVQVDAGIAPRRGALARELDVVDALHLQLLGANRGKYVNLRVDGLPTQSSTMLDDSQRFEVSGATPPVRYLNRGQLDSTSSASVPGPQYLVLSFPAHQRAFLVPYKVQVSLIGTAGKGRPEYVGPRRPPGRRRRRRGRPALRAARRARRRL